jgi:hypothetical protein
MKLDIEQKIWKLQEVMSYKLYMQLIDAKVSADKLELIYDEALDNDNYRDVSFFWIAKNPEGKQDKRKDCELWTEIIRAYEDTYSGRTFLKLKDDMYLAWGWET